MKGKKHGKNMTLAVSRDGVRLGIAPFGNFEMASVATLSVYNDGQRMGAIHLAAENDRLQSRLETELHCVLQRCRKSSLTHLCPRICQWCS